MYLKNYILVIMQMHLRVLNVTSDKEIYVFAQTRRSTISISSCIVVVCTKVIQLY